MTYSTQYSSVSFDGVLYRSYYGTENGAKQIATKYLLQRLSGPWCVKVHERCSSGEYRLVATRFGHGRWQNAVKPPNSVNSLRGNHEQP